MPVNIPSANHFMKFSRGSFSRRDFLTTTCAASAGLGISMAAGASDRKPRRDQQRLSGLKFPPLEKVRLGFIGVGGRGTSLLGNLLDIEGVEIKAVCDVVQDRVKSAQKLVTAKGRPEPAGYAKNEMDFEALCKRDDLDLVYVATPWEWHVPMAVTAMSQGKHVAIEVPAAMTLDECWELVDKAEETRRHCIMLENCCYGEIELLVLRMARQGVFGELTHGEAGYLHEARDYLLQDSSSAAWRRRFVSALNGNLYPTHGLGPVATYMGINTGDKFNHLVSMSSLELGLSRRRDALPADNPRRRDRFACGDINTSLIKTAQGRTIMVQFSMVLSRPYSRINLIAGTKGTFCDYPPRLHVDGGPSDWVTDLQSLHKEYGHPLWSKLNSQARESGGHGGMDYVMNRRLIQCLREGLPLDLTVYDAAAWSSIVPLSIASVSKGSAPIEVPDFTRGAWRNQAAGALAAC
jgi:predicted dehydrogenase